MNTVSLTGRLTRDPEIRESSAGDVCRMRLAVDGPGDSDTTFVDVTAFKTLAASCAEYLTQGRGIAVTGRLSYSQWETDDGAKRSKHEVIANQIDFLPGGRSREEDNAKAEATAS